MIMKEWFRLVDTFPQFLFPHFPTFPQVLTKKKKVVWNSAI